MTADVRRAAASKVAVVCVGLRSLGAPNVVACSLAFPLPPEAIREVDTP